jgi:hypothetical protein
VCRLPMSMDHIKAAPSISSLHLCVAHTREMARCLSQKHIMHARFIRVRRDNRAHIHVVLRNMNTHRINAKTSRQVMGNYTSFHYLREGKIKCSAIYTLAVWFQCFSGGGLKTVLFMEPIIHLIKVDYDLGSALNALCHIFVRLL